MSFTLSSRAIIPVVLLGIILLGVVPSVSAELIYDPVTNTYIDTFASGTVGSTQNNTITTSSSTDPVYEYVTLSNGDIVYQKVIAPTIVQEVIPSTVTSPLTISPTVTSQVKKRDVEDLLDAVALEKEELSLFIQESEASLWKDVNATLANVYGGAHREDLSCIDVIKDLEQAKLEIMSTIDVLYDKVESKASSISSNIQETLDRTESDLIQGAVLQAEYLGYTDELESYVQSMNISVDTTLAAIKTDVLDYVAGEISIGSTSKITDLGSSRMRRNEVETLYNRYIQNTTMMHDLFENRSGAFSDAGDFFFASYEDAIQDNMNEKFGSSPLISAYAEKFLDEQRVVFDEYADRSGILLYPVTQIQELENSVDVLRAYFDGSSCDDLLAYSSFLADTNVLMTSIQEVDIVLRASYVDMGSPLSWIDVEQYILTYYNAFMRDTLQSNYKIFVSQNEDTIAVQLAKNITAPGLIYNTNSLAYEIDVDFEVFTFSTREKNRTEEVLVFLRSMKSGYIENSNLVGYTSRLSTAYDKAVAAYDILPNKTSKAAKQLKAIIAAIYIMK